MLTRERGIEREILIFFPSEFIPIGRMRGNAIMGIKIKTRFVKFAEYYLIFRTSEFNR